MRIKRRKAYRKHLEFFDRCFSIRAPFTVLCDGNFINAFANRLNTNSKEELQRLLVGVLEGNVEAVTTEAVMKELRTLHALNATFVSRGAVELAMAMKHLRVGSTQQESESFTAAQSITKLVSSGINRHKYLVATIDDDFILALRELPGVPLIYLSKIVLVLEEPSLPSREYAKKMETKSLKRQLATLHALPNEIPDHSPIVERPVKRRKRALGPNPLSMKKKQPRTNSSGTTSSSHGSDAQDNTRKKRRRKKAISDDPHAAIIAE